MSRSNKTCFIIPKKIALRSIIRNRKEKISAKNTWWPDLEYERDSLSLAEVWDFRITELRAVIGKQKIKDYSYCFSEMVFTFKEGKIRLPYTNQRVAIAR